MNVPEKNPEYRVECVDFGDSERDCNYAYSR